MTARCPGRKARAGHPLSRSQRPWSRQAASPTYAHIQGDYRFANRFEDPSRATEDREIGMQSFMDSGPGKAQFTGR